jgi:hypothetical protein
MPWEGKENLDTALFDEFANIGDDTNVTGEEEYGVPHNER